MSTLSKVSLTAKAVDAIWRERVAQDLKWGEQNHPDGTGLTLMSRYDADVARDACERAFAEGYGTFKHILIEEVYEALAESDKEALKTELIQVAAVAVAWVEKLIREENGATAPTNER